MTGNLPYPDETVITVSRNALKIGRDHETELGQFGVNDTFLSDFENDIQTAESTPSNDVNKIDLREFTKSKDDILDDCYLWGRHLKLRMEMAFGKRSQEAGEFPSEQLYKADRSEKIMLPLMETLVKLASKYHEQLQAYGQTPENLAEGTTLFESLRNAESDQEMKKLANTSSTEIRYEIFKKLYTKVNQINRVGRVVYMDEPARLALFKSPWQKSVPSGEESAAL